MQRVVVADAHLGQRRGDIARMAALLSGAAERGYGEVIYLGDVCQYLIGMSKFWTDTVDQLLDLWGRFRSGGGRIVLVEGNRDFFLDHAELGAHIDQQCRIYRFQVAGRHFELVHGDRVNRRDLQYRFWAAVSKSGVARLWARLLPRAVAVRIVQDMERRLALSNRRFRYTLPVEDLVRSARRSWSRGVHVLLWGHFHQPWFFAADGALAAVLPDWLQSDLAAVVDECGQIRLVDSAFGERTFPTADTPRYEAANDA